MTSDIQIVEALKSGNTRSENEALSKLYQRNEQRINNYILQNSGTKNDASELLQDALVVFFKNVRKPGFELTSKIDTYLYSVVRNIWFKHLRKTSSKVKLIDVDQFYDLKVEPQDFTFGNEQSPMLKGINQLGDVCKSVLRMYYYEEKGIQVIMDIMGYKNEQVVRNKKSLCLKKLKELLRA